jgi:hypothetical protein
MLASVVSDGSPGSSLLIDRPTVAFPFRLVSESAVKKDRVRARFEGGIFDASTADRGFLCLPDEVAGAADSSPSSPEASREEGCKRSVVDDVGMVTVVR